MRLLSVWLRNEDGTLFHKIIVLFYFFIFIYKVHSDSFQASFSRYDDIDFSFLKESICESNGFISNFNSNKYDIFIYLENYVFPLTSAVNATLYVQKVSIKNEREKILDGGINSKIIMENINILNNGNYYKYIIWTDSVLQLNNIIFTFVSNYKPKISSFINISNSICLEFSKIESKDIVCNGTSTIFLEGNTERLSFEDFKFNNITWNIKRRNKATIDCKDKSFNSGCFFNCKEMFNF